MVRGCLRVLQWNADGVKLKAGELVESLIAHRVDIGLIQESKLMPGDRTPSFPGFAVVRRDRGAGVRGGGLLTLVREDIPFRRIFPVQSNEGPLESLAVEVPLGGGPRLTIVNVYCPPTRQGQRETGAAGFDPATLPANRNAPIGGILMPTRRCGTISNPAMPRERNWRVGSWTAGWCA